MIENIIVTKTGSESENSDRTIFSSTTAWENDGTNLIVFVNNSIVKKDTYTVLDFYKIQFDSALKTTDEIKFVITKLDTDFATKVDRFNKQIQGKTQTSLNKEDYEENIPTKFITHADEIWSSTISASPETAINEGVVQVFTQKTLTQDVTVSSKKGWYASSNGTLAGRIKDWVPPKFGQDYFIRLYDYNNNEIPSSDPMKWNWDYASGYLSIQNVHSYTIPFKITGYQYIGSYGIDTDGVGQWKNPIPTYDQLPTEGNVNGDARIVLEDNSLWRWNETTLIWTKLISSVVKDSVDTYDDLNSVTSNDGDIRFVIDENAFYNYNNSVWTKIVYDHNHDDRYYTETEIDTLLTSYATASHNHDSLYYRQYEVTNMVRWRVSVETYDDLPEHTSSRDGDVILVRDTNTIYRWDSNALPLGEWIAIISGNLTWKNPVDTITNLPSDNNTTGDVRMVLDEGNAFWWDGTQWLQFTNSDHNHDDRYYTETEIDTMIYWKSPVSNYSSLPVINNKIGDVRLTLDNNKIYKWDGSSWVIISASPRWREPVDLYTSLPTTGNIDGDIRVAKDTMLIYLWNATNNIWNNISNPSHTHNALYYTKTELDSGQLDNRYYTETEVDAMFDPTSGHNHDGENSAQIDYNNLLNIPYFYWKDPVSDFDSLPLTNNTVGDARIALSENGLYTWTGVEWVLINEGLFADVDHNHDTRYYTKTEIDTLLSNLQLWVTNQLALKADLTHTHDDRYYTETEIDQEFENRFDVDTGHDHDGINSKKISYYSLEDIPPLSAHTHDDRYYTKTELATSGEAEVHWDNVTSKPDLANGHWKSPVQTVAELPATGNDLYDIRMVLDDSDIYEWSGTEWVYVGHWANQYVCYWREPVDTYNTLPLTDNVNGDVRLVLEENCLYRWDSSIDRWIIIATTKTNMQVYLNGLHLTKNIEWIRIKDKAAELLVDIQGGDRVTIIVNGDYYLRKDFTAYEGQTIFEITNEYYRQDFILTQNQTLFELDNSYTVGGGNLIVWWNGILQREGLDYTETTDTSFTFKHTVYNNDHVIAIIMDQLSGEGEYTIEEQIAESGQTVFYLENFYVPGSKTLLVYLNGHLLKSSDDYYELSNSTIELKSIVATEEDTLTFIIFGEGISSGCCNAEDIILGTPTDGEWSDGLLELFDEMKVVDSIDDINEILLDIAPDAPTTFEDESLESEGLTLVSGYESDYNINYETSAGAYHDYLTEDTLFYLYSPNDTAFGNADKGTINLYLNNELVDSFRLYAAFVEDNEKTNQSSVSYGQQVYGAREDEGVTGTNGALRNSENGYISIMSIGIYNDFKLWQKGRIRINMTSNILRQGYNTIYITHESSSFSYKSSTLKLFFDSDSSRPYLATQKILEQESLISSKYCSGVRYYSIGDKFNLRFTGVSMFNNTYIATPVTLEMSGLQTLELEWNHEDASGYSSPPRLGDLYSFDGTITLNKYGEYNINTVMNIRTQDPFGYGESAVTTSVNRLVNTYLNSSTDLIEYFRDEIYRLPEDSYNNIVTTRTNSWNSTLLLNEGNALVFNESLMFANIDFSSNYYPTQTANYSTFSNAQKYYRSFYKKTAKNNGTLKIEGITLNDLMLNKVLVDIKLPTQTGWLSLNSNYDVSVFTGIDGDGCLLTSSGNEFTYSSGIFSTANSGYMIIVKITLPTSSSPHITYMEVKW